MPGFGLGAGLGGSAFQRPMLKRTLSMMDPDSDFNRDTSKRPSLNAEAFFQSSTSNETIGEISLPEFTADVPLPVLCPLPLKSTALPPLPTLPPMPKLELPPPAVTEVKGPSKSRKRRCNVPPDCYQFYYDGLPNPFIIPKHTVIVPASLVQTMIMRANGL